MTPEENRNSSPAGGTGASAADGSERSPRRRRRRRGSRGRGRNRRTPGTPAPELANEASPEPASEGVPDQTPAPTSEAVPDPTPAPASEAAPDLVPSSDTAPCDVEQIVQEAKDIANDCATHERPELFAHRLPAIGAEIVHWRPRGEREFRYLLRESFD